MKIEAQETSTTAAGAVLSKAENRLLLDEVRLLREENGKLREAMEMARQCIDADDVIGAHNILVAALEGKSQSSPASPPATNPKENPNE